MPNRRATRLMEMHLEALAARSSSVNLEKAPI